ncbi:MAG: 2'-5' RNA ligase family protein [Candidatus Zixiibacteriota bacterium]|nr:MAG: 2'-5' RNA ligase family protein [candidate division Zixibacteria bacterium]
MRYSYTGMPFPEQSQKLWAVAIFLPRELDSIIAPLRERFDPDYDICASHITIVFPFESTLTLDELSQIIGDEVSRMEAVEIELELIDDFYPDSPVIYWSVKNNESLNVLHKRLYSRLDLPLPVKRYIPHVTVAREISHHRVMLVKERIVPYLSEEKFPVRSIDLISPVASHKWVSVRSFSLPRH